MGSKGMGEKGSARHVLRISGSSESLPPSSGGCKPQWVHSEGHKCQVGSKGAPGSNVG